MQICLQMWSDSEEPYDGAYYRLGRTLNAPQNLQTPRPYLMIGGGGERKTLRLVAQYADACNIFANPEAPRKLEALRRHCDAVGRDYDQIEKTACWSIGPQDTKDDIVRTALEMGDLGVTVAYIYTTKVTNPDAIIDLFASVVPEIQ